MRFLIKCESFSPLANIGVTPTNLKSILHFNTHSAL